MENQSMNEMEKGYNRQLEKDFIEMLKGKIKKLSKDELRECITNFLRENCICTLATCSNNIPRSTIVRYRSKDLTIYVLTEGGGKIKNIRENPKVSASICGEYSGFQSVKGLQVWGKAEIIDPKDTEKYAETRKILNPEDREDLKNAGINNIPDMYIIKIDIERARYLNFSEGILNQVLTVKKS
jgi:nitroimidazol reductase NimA-like FMN-containing flavoprotein (pyridoxamine 5'-phosphate oxidase superfamily)